MKPSSAKAKGRRLQDYVVQRILGTFPELEPDDVKGAIMGESGTDIKLSPAARNVLPWGTEVKNQQRLNIWAALQQAEANAPPIVTPVVVFSRNRTEVFAALTLDDLLDVYRRLHIAEEFVYMHDAGGPIE